MKVTIFEKDGQKEWTSTSSKDGKTRTSMAIVCESNTLDLATGNINTEKSIIWVRNENPDVVKEVVNETMLAIKAGQLKPFRAFSEKPFYDGQEEDINPSNGLKLGRYSQVRLCPADKHASLHRQYVTVETTEEPVETQKEVKIGTE